MTQRPGEWCRLTPGDPPQRIFWRQIVVDVPFAEATKNSGTSTESIRKLTVALNVIFIYPLVAILPPFFSPSFSPCGALPELRNQLLPPMTHPNQQQPRHLDEPYLHTVRKIDAFASLQREAPGRLERWPKWATSRADILKRFASRVRARFVRRGDPTHL